MYISVPIVHGVAILSWPWSFMSLPRCVILDASASDRGTQSSMFLLQRIIRALSNKINIEAEEQNINNKNVTKSNLRKAKIHTGGWPRWPFNYRLVQGNPIQNILTPTGFSLSLSNGHLKILVPVVLIGLTHVDAASGVMSPPVRSELCSESNIVRRPWPLFRIRLPNIGAGVRASSRHTQLTKYVNVQGCSVSLLIDIDINNQVGCRRLIPPRQSGY